MIKDRINKLKKKPKKEISNLKTVYKKNGKFYCKTTHKELKSKSLTDLIKENRNERT